ncbi:MAG TPA: hypothetical protein VK812_14105 [Candidatus Binatus sp.]|jgi:hypothetical protein|nr:hypothetical protein [Candidatus Binatus sp.]
MPKTNLPWISQIAERREAKNFADSRDTGESEDPLGAIVEANASGFIVTQATRLTEVRQETTDDN